MSAAAANLAPTTHSLSGNSDDDDKDDERNTRSKQNQKFIAVRSNALRPSEDNEKQWDEAALLFFFSVTLFILKRIFFPGNGSAIVLPKPFKGLWTTYFSVFLNSIAVLRLLTITFTELIQIKKKTLLRPRILFRRKEKTWGMSIHRSMFFFWESMW